jgi:hypothetical protein
MTVFGSSEIDWTALSAIGTLLMALTSAFVIWVMLATNEKTLKLQSISTYRKPYFESESTYAELFFNNILGNRKIKSEPTGVFIYPMNLGLVRGEIQPGTELYVSYKRIVYVERKDKERDRRKLKSFRSGENFPPLYFDLKKVEKKEASEIIKRYFTYKQRIERYFKPVITMSITVKHVDEMSHLEIEIENLKSEVKKLLGNNELKTDILVNEEKAPLSSYNLRVDKISKRY